MAPAWVRMADPAGVHQERAEAVEASVLDTLRSGRWVGGPSVQAAEALAAAWTGRRGAVGVASGTDALALSLLALGVRPGAEVLVPALTFFATAGAVLSVGAKPVVVDVTEDGQLSLESAAPQVTPRTAAIVPVHLFGSRAPHPEFGVPVLDDLAQAVGLEPAPRRAPLAAISTYPTKTWFSAGDGGFVVGDDPELLERVRLMGSHGAFGLHRHQSVLGAIGRNSRLDALQAAVLVAHAPALPARLAARRALAARYDANLPSWARPLPRCSGSAVHHYVLRVPRREALQAHLREHHVETAVYYPLPLNQQPALAHLRHAPTPCADQLCQEVLALPIHHRVGEAGAEQVLAALWAFRP